MHANWSDSIKIEKFYKHLKPGVKDIVVLTKREDCPTDFADYIKFIIEVDNCLHNCELEYKLEGKNSQTSITHGRDMKNALQGYGHIFKIISQLPSKIFITARQYIKL